MLFLRALEVEEVLKARFVFLLFVVVEVQVLDLFDLRRSYQCSVD